jgi:hypothetical protein
MSGAGNSYRIVVGDASWLDANAACIAEGAHLPIVDDAIEAANGQIGDWIGITDVAVEDEWRTLRGDIATYLPWASGEPDGGTLENCGRLDDASGLFEARDCASLRDFSCECDL